MRKNGQSSHSGQIFNPKFEISMDSFLFEYEFWWGFRQHLYVIERKTAFVMQNFRILGASGGGRDHFFDETPKSTSLTDFTRFEPLCVRIRSRVLSLGDSTKKGTLQKATETLYITYLRGIPHRTKFK